MPCLNVPTNHYEAEQYPLQSRSALRGRALADKGSGGNAASSALFSIAALPPATAQPGPDDFDGSTSTLA
jgi:hypothetical protein